MSITVTMEARAAIVADEIVGTARSLFEFATNEECDSMSFCEALDQLVFCCENCGWWCAIDEMAEPTDRNESQICTDCSEE